MSHQWGSLGKACENLSYMIPAGGWLLVLLYIGLSLIMVQLFQNVALCFK